MLWFGLVLLSLEVVGSDHHYHTFNLLACFCPDVVSQMKVSGEAWVLANLHISGYYRVNYDPTNWERLIHLLGSNHKVRTPPGDRTA